MLKYYDDIKEIRDVGPRHRDELNYWQPLLDNQVPARKTAFVRRSMPL
jgi:hypothetical protein